MRYFCRSFRIPLALLAIAWSSLSPSGASTSRLFEPRHWSGDGSLRVYAGGELHPQGASVQPALLPLAPGPNNRVRS